MRWLVRLLVGMALAALALASRAESLLSLCQQFNANATMACELSPGGFSDWTYNTGYGPTANTEEQSAANATAYFAGSHSCSSSYALGPQVVELRDDFTASLQPISTTRSLTIRIVPRYGDGQCAPPVDFAATVHGARAPQCKPGFSLYWDSSLATAFCGSPDPLAPPKPLACRIEDGAAAGNPILPATGEKYRAEQDYTDSGPGSLGFTRIYRSRGGWTPLVASALGPAWTHNHHTTLVEVPAIVPGPGERTTVGGIPRSSIPGSATITSPEGYRRFFFQFAGSAHWTPVGSLDTLAKLADGTWTYRRSEDDATLRFDAQGKLLSTTARNGWATTYNYNAARQLATITNAFGRTLTLAYDPVGRLASVTTPDARVIRYGYDTAGRLGLVTHPDGKTRGFVYANNGQLASIGHPNGSVVSFVYDATGQVVQLNDNGTPAVTNITWNALGQPLRWNWAFVPVGGGAGLAGRRTYDTAGRLRGTESSSYTYDPAGRITLIVQQLYKPGDNDPTHTTIAAYNAVWRPAYDATGRITRFDAEGGSTDSAEYGYDANGNRTSSSVRIGASTTSRDYTIDGASNRITGVTQTLGATTTSVGYGYNANGDLTSDGLRSFSYDAEGRLSGVTTGATDASPTTRYAHNALGQRVFKTEPLYPPAQREEADSGFMQTLVNFFAQLWQPAVSDAERLGTAYVYDESGSLIYEAGTGGANSTGTTRHIYLPTANGPMPIMAVVNGQRFAVSSDHLNTPRRITNDQGQPVWQWAYSAFGETKPTTARNRFADPSVTPNVGTTNIAEFVYNQRYDGMYLDAESGLFYNYFRSYKPDFGYTQNDPIGLFGGPNRKTPLENNPLRFSDPRGLQVKGIRNSMSLLEGGGSGTGNGGGSGLTLGLIGAGAGAWIGTNITGPMWAKAPDNAYDPDGPKAPGRPGAEEGFKDPKGGENWVRNPNPGRGGSSHGWEDDRGRVWCPTGQGGRAHGGPHWDVELPNGRHVNVPPGQNINDLLR